MDVYGVFVPIPESMDINYRRLYRAWLPQRQAQHADAIVFCQLDHPESAAKEYGIAPPGRLGFGATDGR